MYGETSKLYALFVIGGLLVVSACQHQAQPEEGTAVPAVSFYFTPEDGTTNESGAALTMHYFSLLRGVREVSPGLEEPLHAAVFLKTWPEREPVEIGFETNRSSQIVVSKVIPRSPLQDRWYLLVAGSEMPSNVIYSPLRLPDGSAGVRFRPGSHPRVREFTVCTDHEGYVRLGATFSEPVTVDTPDSEILTLKTDDVLQSCVTTSVTSLGLEVRCGRVSVESKAIVEAKAGGFGATGERLEAGSWQIDPEVLTRSNCLFVTPPI